MTVEDLIEKLKAFDPKATVVVGGFDEVGFADIQFVEMVKAVSRGSGADIYGEYESADNRVGQANILMLVKIDHS